MNPVRSVVLHGRAVLLVTVLLAAGGLLAALRLPSAIYPALRFPRVVVIAHSGTTPPQSMALGVTRPIEQAVMEVPGIRRIRSRTFRGSAEISAQFGDGTDMITALQQVQTRIADIRASLPADLELTVERITPAAFPILSFNLTGGLPIADLRDYAYYVVRPALARVPGTGRVEVLSSDSREIEVVVDPAKALAAGLTVDDVSAALADANKLAPVGRFVKDDAQYLAVVSGLWDSTRRIADTPILLRSGAVVKVGDVASVAPGTPDRTLLVTGNGHDAATVSVSQQAGANVLDVKTGIDGALSDLARTLPSGLTMTKVYDLAEFVSASIGGVRDAILVGGLLAALVLLLFLRDLRMTAIAAATLPLTVLGTFLLMLPFGASINVMSMGGIAVAIGLVIDDAVVVVENIHRLTREAPGGGGVEGATLELVAPVVGSTLTTVVVLLPLGLLSGVAGQFFRALSLTLSIAVLISLVLAFTLIPLLCSIALRDEAAPAALPASDRGSFYGRTLAATLARPRAALVAGAVLLAAGALLIAGVPSGFLPGMDEGGFVIDYITPPGTALEATDRVVRRIESLVAATPEVASFSRRTGSELGMFATEQNKGDILVRLVPRSKRKRSADEVIAALRPQVAEAAPEADVEFTQLLQDMIGDLAGAPTPVEIKVFGDDPGQLEPIAERVESTLAGVRGVVDVVGPRRGNPDVTWTIDLVAAARVGLSVDEVATQAAHAWLGEVPTELRLLDRSVPVRVRYPDADRFDPARLADTPIRTPAGAFVPLKSLAHAAASTGQTVITRENLRQMAQVTARLEDRDLGSAVAESRRALAGVRLPVGFLLDVGGQDESQRQAFHELVLVLVIAASLVLVILVVLFRAFVPALLILAAAPLSFSGALLLLAATRTELNVSSAMGLILLVGLVVKNGIVLLDYAHRLHDNGLPLRDAVVEAARVRLRPILMTTLCTLFGLLPLAFGLGAGSELQKPLALAVIGGLGLSTVATLYLVPSIYVWWRSRASSPHPKL